MNDSVAFGEVYTVKCDKGFNLTNQENMKCEEEGFNGPPATGGALGPPLGLDFKLPKNGFSEAPQTSQVPRTSLWTNFGEKNFWSYDPPRTP